MIRDRSTLWWAGVHLLLTLSLPILLVMLAGCMRAKAKKEDLGPTFSDELISKKLVDLQSRASLSSLAVGQSISYTHTRRIENDDTAEDLGGRVVEVIDRQDVDNEAHFTLDITETQRLDSGKFRDLKSESALWLSKAPSVAAMVRADAAAAGGPTAGDVTFHHLQEIDTIIDPPDAIKYRSGCNGLTSCQIHVHYIRFDAVIWASSDNYQKISYDLGYSLDTPFLPYGVDIFEQSNGTLITDCRSTFIPIESRNVYVRDCYDLADFKK